MRAIPLALMCMLLACAPTTPPVPAPGATRWPAVARWTTLDLEHPDNYANPDLPAPYRDPAVVALDNARLSPITDAGATLGRALFFDKRLSINRTTSCASCHLPAFGFTDTARFSRGHTGAALRVRSMRLVNARWYAGPGFLWDRRAPTLEAQATQPITHSMEMGWDGSRGGMPALIRRMDSLPYYAELFRFAFGDATISTERIQRALAMYVRSIVAVRSRWDIGYARVYDPALPDKGLHVDVPGLTEQENLGRSLFMRTRGDGGFGCASCHQPPTFSLDSASGSNGVTANETIIFKAPSLKNVALTGHLMHNGRFESLELAIAFYGGFQNPGPALDARLREADGGQLRMPIGPREREALAAFLRTLTDTTLAHDPRYSDPFRH